MIGFRSKNQLLMALARIDSEEGSNYREPMDVADRYGITYASGWLRKAVTDFRDMGYVNEAFAMAGSEDRGLSCTITGPGLEEAESLAEQFGISLFGPAPPSQPVVDIPQDDIPASDRIVRRSDNEESWGEAAEGVKELRAAMETANDYGGLDENEFHQKLAEVRALQIYLDSPQVQWEALERLATKTIVTLAGIFAVSAIGDLSTKLLGPLGDILGKSLLGGP